jgi:hypothetical protein
MKSFCNMRNSTCEASLDKEEAEMARSTFLAAMVLLLVFGAGTGPISSGAHQDLAFSNGLAPTAEQAPARICLATAQGSPVIALTCVGAFCVHDSDCYSCPGGQSAWFCSSSRRCTPY